MKSKKSLITDSLLPPGFSDEVSDKAAIEHKYKNIIINLFQNNGYKLVKTPLIEYAKNSNLKNILKIRTKTKQRETIIRDDITLQISRISNRLLKEPRPIKLCYYGEVVRNKGSMLRPERQFLQVGAECIGENSYFADVEMLELAYKSLKLVGVKDITIELSSRLFLNKIYSFVKSDEKLRKIKLLVKRKDLSNLKKIISAKYKKQLENIFSCTGNFSNKKNQLKKLVFDKSSKNEINNLININKVFLKKFPNTNFFLDLTETDDKNYHNGIRFTIFAENVRGEIARGGRYISKNKNLKENATGFTCYMDTILRSSSKIEKFKKILVPFSTSSQKKSELIKKKYVVETYFGNEKNLKKKAIEKTFESYLRNNKIVSLRK